MPENDVKAAESRDRWIRCRSRGRVWLSARQLASSSTACLISLCLATPVLGQTITVVGTPHLSGVQPPPSKEQFVHTTEALSAFNPTQVCVERMSGERIEALIADPARHGFTLQPTTHGRALAPTVVPIGMQMQLMLERSPTGARREAGELLSRWTQLNAAEKARVIGLQLAGFEFHSAVLNWSWLDDAERHEAEEILDASTVKALNGALHSVHEVYSLGVPLARQAGLHELCTADSLEDETAGMRTALDHGGKAVLESPQVTARFEELSRRTAAAWHPESGPGALTAMLRFFNSDEYAELDRRLQWQTLREFDNEAGAFHRRLMYWHARTAEISAELFRALARAPEERVLFIVGSAHRTFTEADLRAQPWVEVVPASVLLEAQ